MRRITMRPSLAARVWRMARGQSYWHVPQPPGRVSRPESLEGYFDDLAAKTAWDGPIDDMGLPLNRLPDGRTLPFPTTRLQFGLGHWDARALSGRKRATSLERFRAVASWAVASQDREGGWPIWPLIDMPAASPYSAMSQGQAASLLARAWPVTDDARFLHGAQMTCRCLMRSQSDRGTSRAIADGKVILEELPAGGRLSGVLNGWIFALFGLYDLRLTGGFDSEMDAHLAGSLETLAALGTRFDRGYWSDYDMRRHIASPFYHNLHIAQLEALESICRPSEGEAFLKLRTRFEHFRFSAVDRNRALILKFYQKLKALPTVVLS